MRNPLREPLAGDVLTNGKFLRVHIEKIEEGLVHWRWSIEGGEQITQGCSPMTIDDFQKWARKFTVVERGEKK